MEITLIKKTAVVLFTLCTKMLLAEETSSFYAGPEVYSTSLHIDGVSSDFRGTLAGAVLGYTYKKSNSLYVNVCVKWALGQVRNSGHPSRFIHDELIEGQLGFVGRFWKMELIPFLGFGFHYLIEDRKESETYTAMKTSYRDYYLPLGLKWRYYFCDRLNAGLNFAWWKDLDPSVKISGIKGAHWTLDRKEGYRIAMPFEGFLDSKKRWSVCLEPFWEQYQLGSDRAVSSTGDSLGIKKQTFNYYGGTLTASIWF